MLMAFLQRIVNGGGRVEREYGLGRGSLDLMIFSQGARHAIEVPGSARSSLLTACTDRTPSLP